LRATLALRRRGLAAPLVHDGPASGAAAPSTLTTLTGTLATTTATSLFT